VGSKLTTSARFRIFLSHSSSPEDREVVLALRTLLRRHTFDVYMAEFDVQPGNRILDTVEKNLKACQAVVVMITPNSSRSQWVMFELGMANLSRIPVVPLVQLGSDVPKPLAGIEYVAFERDDPKISFDVVVRHMITLRDQWETVQGYKELAMVGGLLAGLKLLDYLDKQGRKTS